MFSYNYELCQLPAWTVFFAVTWEFLGLQSKGEPSNTPTEVSVRWGPELALQGRGKSTRFAVPKI